MKPSEPIPKLSHDEAESALLRNAPKELARVVLAVGMHAESLPWAEDFCASLCVHADEEVRGNALLALGHLARRFGGLTEHKVKPMVLRALKDKSAFVRAQVIIALEDMEFFQRWQEDL
jgi:hypothetical protein